MTNANEYDLFETIARGRRVPPKPIKMDRSRWEGCAECEAVYGEDDWDCAGFHEYRIVDCYLQYFDHQFGWEGVKIKFCPNCGRPLTEEAWSELERKIGGDDETD